MSEQHIPKVKPVKTADPAERAAWVEVAVAQQLGFRIRRVALRTYQVQYLNKRGAVTRVRPASNEEVLMFRTLCTPTGQQPYPATNVDKVIRETP